MTRTQLTLFDIMVEEGAYLLMAGLYEQGLVPHTFLQQEAELLRICREVEAEWLRGEIASVLYKDVLWEVYRRLREQEDSS